MASAHAVSPALLGAETYREFFAQALAEKKSQQSGFSYQVLVNRAGLKAKSFPLEVIQGKKRLSTKSARSLSHALGLSKDLEELFLSLLFLEEESERPPHWGEERIKSQIQKIRHRIGSKQKQAASPRKTNFPAPQYFPEVYASLGTNAKGASFSEVVNRSKLKPELVTSTLEWILKNGFAKKDQENYIPQAPALFFEKLGQDLFFKEIFQLRLNEAKQTANENFHDLRRLFLSSVFSVQEKDLPNLALELKELMNRYIDQSENPEGDRLARLSVALF